MHSPNVELIEIFASNILNGIGLAPSDIPLIPTIPQVMLIVILFQKALGSLVLMAGIGPKIDG